jgi:hypothetical protein
MPSSATPAASELPTQIASPPSTGELRPHPRPTALVTWNLLIPAAMNVLFPRGKQHAACKRPRNPSSDKHAAEIWIFEAGALNLCYADSIPREVLLSRDPADRLCEAARAFFIEAPHDRRPPP